jgi:MFS family permease
MAILLSVALGGAPIGAPLVGWVADTFGPRWSMGVGATAGLLAAAVGAYYLVRFQHVRAHRDGWRIRIITVEPAGPTADRALPPRLEGATVGTWQSSSAKSSAS